MKIRKVYIKNINSLKGVHEIDFTVPPLSTAGLFAITGPTGIGKSTILDAICLALYNTVPRFGKNVSKSFIENTGALITRGTRDAIAGVEYECKGALYFSKWSIAFNRNNNLNDYHMELADSGQVVMDLKKSEVPAKNEEIIGLNFDQFIKSMMLAQGEFARFLRSNKDDRGQLLEKITGTGIYRLLGKRAFEKFREKGQQLAALKENIGRVHQEIKPEEERIKLEADLKEREKEFAVLDKQYRNIQKQIEIKDKINALLKRIGEINALQEENNKKIEIFKSVYGERIKKHESLIPFEQKLNELKDLYKHLQTLQKEVENLERQKKELEQKGEAHLLKIQEFVNKKVSDMEALAELEKLELLVMEMDENMKLMAARYKEVWKSTEKNLTVIPLKIGAELTSEDLDIFNNARSIFMERVSTLKNKHKGQDLFSIDNLKKTKVIDIERISSLKKEIQIIAQFEEKLLKQEKIKETLFEESKKLPKTLEKTQAEVEVTEIALRQLEDQKIKDLLISKYELDRENLQAGEPCFLCGSTEHPYSIHAPDKSGNLDTVIEEQKLKLDKLKGLKVGIAQQLERLQFDLKEKSDLIQEFKNEINSHTIEIHSFEKSLKIDLKETDIDSVIEGLQGELEMLEEFERTLRLEEYFETAKVNIDELLSLKKEIISLREKRNNLYTGKDIRNEAGKIREDFRSIKQASIYNSEQLLDKKEKCSVADKEKIQQEDNLIKDLKKVNIRDINEAFSSVLTAVEYQKIQQEERNLLDKKSRWEESVSTLTEELKGYKKDEPKEDRDALSINYSRVNEKMRICQSERDELLTTYSIQKDRLQELERLDNLYKKEQKENEKWVLLKEAIGDSEGKRFSTFAQQLTLQHLTVLANKRLTTLTNRYILALPGESEDDDLIVLDQDMGMERRSVKTLSGGESFLISLSLALGLSDLASRNVNIESLFIDEGFGTLDPDALEQVLTTLEILQSETNKTIGVISHVSALKERIATRIEMVRAGQGFGKIMV